MSILKLAIEDIREGARKGLAPTWSTVTQIAIGAFVVGIYVGAIIMAVALR